MISSRYFALCALASVFLTVFSMRAHATELSSKHLMPSDTSEMDVMRTFIESLAAHSAAVEQEYHTAIDNSGWGNILDLNRILSDSTFSQGKATIKAARHALAELVRRTDSIFASLDNSVGGLPLSESTKRGMIEGIKDGRKKIEPWIDSANSIEGEFFTVAEQLLNLLEAERGYWIVEADEIYLEREPALNRYNELIVYLGSLAERQEIYTNKVLAFRQQSISTLKDNDLLRE